LASWMIRMPVSTCARPTHGLAAQNVSTTTWLVTPRRYRRRMCLAAKR
jgi:hypothetical protein